MCASGRMGPFGHSQNWRFLIWLHSGVLFSCIRPLPSVVHCLSENSIFGSTIAVSSIASIWEWHRSQDFGNLGLIYACIGTRESWIGLQAVNRAYAPNFACFSLRFPHDTFLDSYPPHCTGFIASSTHTPMETDSTPSNLLHRWCINNHIVVIHASVPFFKNKRYRARGGSCAKSGRPNQQISIDRWTQRGEARAVLLLLSNDLLLSSSILQQDNVQNLPFFHLIIFIYLYRRRYNHKGWRGRAQLGSIWKDTDVCRSYIFSSADHSSHISCFAPFAILLSLVYNRP